MFGMLNDLQAPIEHEEETEELRLEDEIPMNVGIDIDEDRTNNIFQDLLNEACIMSSSYLRNNFLKTDAMFLEFEDDLDKIARGSSSVDDNARYSSQQSATPTPRRHAYQAISVCVRKTFPIRCLKWADVGREYIEVVKGDLQRFFVLDFNDQAMNRHFKKYNDPEEARANPRNNQMLELQSQPTVEGSQPFSEDEICDQVLGRRPGYSKGLGWGPKPKARKMMSASSFTTSCFQSATKREIQILAKLDQALERIELQDRNFQALALEMEQIRKLIQDMTRAQQGQPHDP
ncbi:CACTA en-spm transposon protein [Cucumis melo var. makuwa]|uniref:CACTA en-spm transposon protein n=1 Tax=Cucumis melo var. makuwa TaxID=1194695 RepID=A0A5A7TBN0_CUCMM|nr:CACTA en-spm transposon protein [Cucumis melo var. makuwa]